MYKLVLSLLAVLVISGCGKKGEPKVAEVPEPAKPAMVASIGFIKGDVQKLLSGKWETAAIGDTLYQGDCLSLPEKAELQLIDGQGGTQNLAGPLTDEVTNLLEKTAAASEAKAGSKVIKSIQKIQGTKQTLTTQTPTAVAGIRGTAGRKPMPPDSTQQDSTSQ
ncbi:MAG: hypothetical protein A2509_05760 [Candidatus Edwardsbacteria bacterium RIFOXYD12_FULL_50_11]|jgi:hypothetical protein|nr:MAG: hypothetical protein A2502_10855 [Candidatus Edwardsbacteria bacterium RifOxyC12_full_54_24]OGF06673.1 MAG: hypothetical protein A2273_00210 [Candidatus Edwardsbacteria bacterium RifOxyA12_full_54_48]OGF10624.1 MAG: hypothetical protein A3K15_05575 [Candidatus Edwardsbacteria bacterium GWE2_54_12]OGF15405.1 MAG: hypothetical protein A2509_05760 [Candidatus Edwardsbacteria bacterium RIFOXYD12_FULL_50_11]OGJ18809.1 MAG: hypothetical protein A2349_07270 [Candidatus Edwardsbacteria bacteriu